MRRSAFARLPYPRPRTISANAAVNDTESFSDSARQSRISCSFGKFLKSNIDVVQHFHVIAKKSHRLHKDSQVPLSLQPKHGVFHRRPKPRSARHSLTLESKTPVIGPESNRLRHQRRRLLSLLLVRIALRNRPLRNTVSGKDHRQFRPSLAASLGPAGNKLLGKSLHQ